MIVTCPKCKTDIEVDDSMLYDEYVYNMETCDVCHTSCVYNSEGLSFFIASREPISVTVDVAIINSKKQLLLVTRKYPPCWGMLALPGGFVDMFETCETAAVREVLEETKLKLEISSLQPFMVLSTPGRDSRGRVISNVYLYTLCVDDEPRAGDDAKTVKFYSAAEIKNVAFDHNLVVKELINRGIIE